MRAGTPPATITKWKAELSGSKSLSRERKALLTLWMGESKLGAEEPDASEPYLAKAARIGKGGAVEGLTTRNRATRSERCFARS